MKEIKKLIQSVKSRNRSNRKVFFFLGNTKKSENKRYFFTPIRESKNFIFFGAVVYNDNICKKILRYIDGKVDFVLVDIEKKVISKNKRLGLVNIERSAKDVIKKSKLHVYKANDLAVGAAETLLNNLFLKDKRGLGGKKLLIFGVGNIGFKLALKFVESGALVYIFRRQKKLLLNFANTINKIKPEATISRVKILKVIPKDLSKFNIIISSTDNNDVIKMNQIEKVTKKNILIDVGKGNFSKDATNYLDKKNIIIYRLDTTSSYFSYLENIIITNSLQSHVKFKRKIKKFKFIRQGIVGQKNDIIIDNINLPKKILGICDGEGGLYAHGQIEKLKIRNLINKNLKLKLKYD